MKGKLAYIQFLNGQNEVDPGYGVEAPNRPDNSLPPGAAQLPVFPFDPTLPDQSLPGSQPGPDNSLPGQGGRPDQGLPPTGGHPSQPIYTPIRPGARFVVKYLACKGLILVPDNSLPGSGAHPDQGLPGAGGHPSQGLPGSQPRPDQGLPGQPGHPSQGLPPTAQPKK
jgi:hypothetical protein